MQNETIVLLGDIAFTGLISTEPDKNIERFALVSPILSKSGFVFANLEVPIKVDHIKNEYKSFIHSSLQHPTEELLKMLNIGCVSLANNHVYDCKMPGLKATIGLLDKLNIYHSGAGWLQNHVEPVIFKNNGLNIAFLAYVDKSTNPKTEHFPELLINYFEIEKVITDILKVRNLVDKVILSLHWGVDYSYYPTTQQIETAHTLIDAGVDIIMGHHPHTIQPFELYKKSYIFYSLGGLTFGDYKKEGKNQLQALYRKTKNGLIANYNPSLNEFLFYSTKEKIGNYVTLTGKDYKSWSLRKWKLFNIKQNSFFVQKVFNFKEKVLDRVFEYFFGYYQNPFKRIFQFSNLKKFRKLF